VPLYDILGPPTANHSQQAPTQPLIAIPRQKRPSLHYLPTTMHYSPALTGLLLSLTSVYRYRALFLSMSTRVWFASLIGLSSTHGLTFLSAASCIISRISSGEPMSEPVILSRFMMIGKGKTVGRPSSGAPTCTNVPSSLSSARYFIMGMDVDETVQIMMSSLSSCVCAHLGSSSVAMNSVAPILKASSFLADVRDTTTTLSAPRAFAHMMPKCPRPPRPIMPTDFPGPAPWNLRGV